MCVLNILQGYSLPKSCLVTVCGSHMEPCLTRLAWRYFYAHDGNVACEYRADDVQTLSDLAHPGTMARELKEESIFLQLVVTSGYVFSYS